MPLYSYAIYILVALSFAYRHRDRLRFIFGDTIRLKGDTTLSLAESWAIAAGADLAARNAEYLDTLPTGLSNSMQILHEWWGIDGRESALRTIRELSSSHAQSDREPDVIDASLSVLLADGLHTAHEPAPTLHAWNLTRLINICRWCYDVRLLTAEEAWTHVHPAAAKLQRAYGSWSQLSTAYLFGYLLWQDGEPTAEYHVLKQNRQRLLEDARSPWQLIPWRTPLQAAP